MSIHKSKLSTASGALASEDMIIINRLRINAHIGVPDEERAQQQMLVVTLKLSTEAGFCGLDDCVEKTVDYAAVCELVKIVAAERPRKLIETLGEDICTAVLESFKVSAITLELEKRILWDTDWVGLSMSRVRG